ncbi:MAG: SRPBCC domain-containing protein [Bacteroidota bacterium]
MSKEIKHTVFFPHPVADVWDYLTQSDLIEQWLMPNDFKPIVGHQFQFKSRPLPQFDFDGNMYCTVMEIVPFEKLVYSWKGGPGNGIITLDSLVVWTLHPKDNGTELLLVHSGFKEMANMIMFDAMNDGWWRNMNKINELINTSKNGPTNV